MLVVVVASVGVMVLVAAAPSPLPRQSYHHVAAAIGAGIVASHVCSHRLCVATISVGRTGTRRHKLTCGRRALYAASIVRGRVLWVVIEVGSMNHREYGGWLLLLHEVSHSRFETGHK